MWITEKAIRKVLLEILGIDEKGIPQLISEVRELVGPKEAVPKLKRELEELKLQKEISERDIQHLVTLKEEKLDIEYKKKELKLKNEFKDKEIALQKEYHEKVMKTVEEARGEMRGTYSEIMKRLPNVNVRLGEEKKK